MNGGGIGFEPDDDLPDVQPALRRHPTDDDEDEERRYERDQKRAHDARSLNGRRTRGVGRRLGRQRAPRNRGDQSGPPR